LLVSPLFTAAAPPGPAAHCARSAGFVSGMWAQGSVARSIVLTWPL